ncbi:MAG TPA: PCP reductase family protein [Gemmatimonadales bacterium]|nr:PCP reductase family protein [Gemmatimonadales bacterium]
MKFLCVECDQQMTFAERQIPGDGTLAATFKCPTCGRVVAMLANPMETQLVSSLGVEIGGRTVPPEPFEMLRANVTAGGQPTSNEAKGAGGPTSGPVWSGDAQERLSRVPSFVRGMVKRIYADYARERGIAEITPAIMDTARAELGLEGM